MVHTTRGIVLRTVKYGDTSIITSVYTALFGVQSYIVKGVRKSSKTSAGKASYFQPAALLEMEVHQNNMKHLQFIREYQWSYLYEKVLSTVASWGTPDNLMFVVGATQATELLNVRNIIPDHFLLVPGVGFQGGSLEEVSKYGMNKDCGLLVNVSRAIIYASEHENFTAEAKEIALQYQVEMREYLK